MGWGQHCSTTTPIAPTVGEGSTTHTSVIPPNMTVSQSHAILLKEMHSLYLHLTNKLTAQSEHINTISLDMLAFKVDIARDLSSLHDRIQAIEANVQKISNILKMREDANKFEIWLARLLQIPLPSDFMFYIYMCTPLDPISLFLDMFTSIYVMDFSYAFMDISLLLIIIIPFTIVMSALLFLWCKKGGKKPKIYMCMY